MDTITRRGRALLAQGRSMKGSVLSPSKGKGWVGGTLTAFSGLSVLGCATYCIVWWPKPAVPTLLIPDVALTCWLYCGTLRPVWGGVAILSGMLLVLAGAGLWLGRAWARRLALVLGALTLPVGVLALYASLLAGGQSDLRQIPEHR